MRRFSQVFASVARGSRLAVLLWLVVVCIPTLVVAQANRPGKAHELLASEAGTWDCEVKMFFQGPGRPPTEFKGVEVNKLVSGGLYLQTSFTYPMGDRGEFEGHSLMGYDPRVKKYVGTWVDNFTSVPSPINGEYDEKSKTMTVRSTVVDGSGKELKSKNVTTWLDDSRKKFAAFLIVEAGGKETEVKLMEMTATKRK
ncbi:MAG: DUF1579 domain-containing protein [Pirellulales bacterium]